jgi:hypothetical protein
MMPTPSAGIMKAPLLMLVWPLLPKEVLIGLNVADNGPMPLPLPLPFPVICPLPLPLPLPLLLWLWIPLLWLLWLLLCVAFAR